MLNKPSPISDGTWDALHQSVSKKASVYQEHVLEVEGVHVDLSRAQIPDSVKPLLETMAKEAKLEEWRDKMFTGEVINTSEDRPVLHTQARDTQLDETKKILGKIKDFVRQIHSEKKYTDIVNLGTGGSHEGPKAVCQALNQYHQDGIKVHFISNIDPGEIEALLAKLNPETTLFLIASKSFTTFETLENAKLARNWLGDLPVQNHFVALTSKPKLAKEYGIKSEHIFKMKKSIGGRFSIWSSIGLSIALQIGYQNFEDLLKGAHALDQHFKNADINKNAPMLLALYGIYHRNVMDVQSHATLPYDHRFGAFVRYVQQLEMESNGKSVDRNGKRINYATAPIIFGGVGSNAQHSFLQLLHQGSNLVSADFICIKETTAKAKDHHQALLASMLAQSMALSEGSKAAVHETHNHFDGGRPSTIISLPKLSPYHLGVLFALYEHKVFCQGILWNINSFDQWGVELGKKLAKDLLKGDLSLPAYLE